MHTKMSDVTLGETLTSLPSNDVQMTSWDSWDDEGEGGGMNATTKMQQLQQQHWHANKKQPPLEPEPETDYFQELNLEPSIRKQQKIVIRKKEEGITSGSSRLTLTSDIPIMSGELGLMDDGSSGWAAESCEDISGDAISAMKETRRTERVSRIAEHQQMKTVKDSGRLIKKDKLSAVKLS